MTRRSKQWVVIRPRMVSTLTEPYQPSVMKLEPPNLLQYSVDLPSLSRCVMVMAEGCSTDVVLFTETACKRINQWEGVKQDGARSLAWEMRSGVVWPSYAFFLILKHSAFGDPTVLCAGKSC